ncbi:MAG: tRNA lysidine(34) synthetase TilS [Ruthenibacterium lactatiformans]
MDEFEARAGAYISQHQMLQKGDTVIVALSGGADSMALFHFLFSVQNVWGLRLRAAHVNHGLRGAAADGDAAFVRAQCAARGVPRMDAARRLKTRAVVAERCLFARLAQAHGAKVATAHTCSDNAETVLFNLARGSAARGAAGIPPVRGPYVRPLLWAQRADVLAYLARCGVPHVTDATNDTDAYARNRIRHGVLPALGARPGAARSITFCRRDVRWRIIWGTGWALWNRRALLSICRKYRTRVRNVGAARGHWRGAVLIAATAPQQ